MLFRSATEGCGHLWAYKNGNSPGATASQIDFIYPSSMLLDEPFDVYGGVGDFEDAWVGSDHASVDADFE